MGVVTAIESLGPPETQDLWWLNHCPSQPMIGALGIGPVSRAIRKLRSWIRDESSSSRCARPADPLGPHGDSSELFFKSK